MDSRDAFIQSLVHSAHHVLTDVAASSDKGAKKKLRRSLLPRGVPATFNRKRLSPRLLAQNESIVGVIVKPPVCVVRGRV
jgi:hypothetical protein